MKLIKSFAFAWQGLRSCFLTQQNFRIHLMALLMVIILGSVLKINKTEWLIITVCSMLVLSMELLNTAIEKICNLITKDIHPVIKVIKDIAAAAVLIVAFGSFICGIIIFLPKILDLLQ
jgi:undecaprenol kinase/diacylglycerol kinase (ATP)